MFGCRKYLYLLIPIKMRVKAVISGKNIKFSRKIGKDPAHPDTIPLNLVKKRKLI